MEGLDNIMRKDIANNWISDLNIKNINNETMVVTHLLFVDDTMVFL